MAKNFDAVCADVFEVFFAVDACLQKHVTSDESTVTLARLLPLIAESMGADVDSDEFKANDTLIRHYLFKHTGYIVDRGRHGGVRKAKPGEPKKKDKKPAEEPLALPPAE